MFKSFVNKYFKATLNELFIDAVKDSIKLSMGSDLFSDSNIHFQNLSFRPDIFDAHLHPLKLVSGHLGDLSIEGVAELALGGKIKISVENIYLLFAVDTVIDPEYIQYLKKILIELQNDNIQHSVIRELLKRIQGFTGAKDPDFKKQRLLMIQLVNYFFKSLQVTIKTVHVRIETPRGADGRCNALGFTLPSIRLSPHAVIRPEGSSKDEPAIGLVVSNLLVYCDYDCESYLRGGRSPTQILAQFTSKWKTEVHTALVLPVDVEIGLAVEIKRKYGLVSPKLIFNVPKLRMVCDHRQVEVIKEIYEQFVLSKKRCQHLITLRATYGREGPPRLVVTGGSHILPTLAPAPYKHTVDAGGHSRIVALLKVRVGDRWKKAFWKHLIRVVLHDVRMVRPLGRWVEIARLALIRKEYAFLYSKLLKRSTKSGNLVFNVNARVDMVSVKKLFDYEMYLSVEAVTIFRTLANMISIVEIFNGKRQQARQTSKGISNVQAYEKIGITWRDILIIHSELLEMQSQSAFRIKFLKPGEDDADADQDDSVSVQSKAQSRKSDESTFFGLARQSSLTGAVNNASHRIASASSGGIAAVNGAVSVFGSFLGGSAHGGSHSAASTSRGFTPVLAGSDDYDSKLFGRREMSAFGDFMGTQELEERKNEAEFNSNPPIIHRKHVFDWSLPGVSPSAQSISEAVQFIISRHQKPLTVVIPDVSFHVKAFEATMKRPLEEGTRPTLGSLTANNFSTSLTITEGSSTVETSKAAPGKLDSSAPKSLHGFASIAGSLIQLRVTLQSFNSTLHIYNKELLDAFVGGRGGVISLEELSKARTGSRPISGNMNSISSIIQQQTFEKGHKGSSFRLENDDDDESDKFVVPGYEVPLTNSSSSAAGKSNTQKSSEDEYLVQLLQSAPNQQFFTLCLMLDFDERSAGAADLQLQFGSVNGILGTELVSFALDEKAKSSLMRISELMDDIKYLSRVRDEAALYIDPETKLPFVETFLFDIIPHLPTPAPTQSAPLVAPVIQSPEVNNVDNNSEDDDEDGDDDEDDDDEEDEEDEEDDDAKPTAASDSLNNSKLTAITVDSIPVPAPVTKPASDPTNRPQQKINRQSSYSFLEGDLTDEERQRRYRKMAKTKRLVRREHLNFLHWRSALSQYVPSAFSVSVRAEPFTIDSFTTLTLERMVRAESQKLADRASVLRKNESEATLAAGQTFFGLNFVRRSYAGVIVQALQELRMESMKKTGGRQKFPSEGKLHVDFPAMECFVAKKSNPPEIFVRAMGIEMKIPIGHETLYDLAALGLKRNMPHYK